MTLLALETPALPAALDACHDLVEQLWVEVPGVGDLDRMAFHTAVVEVAANVFEHAAKGQPVRFRLVLHAAEDRLEAHFEDRGCAYEPAEAEPGPDAESGRGLAMARALVDEVAYERDGPVNRWLVVRTRSA